MEPTAVAAAASGMTQIWLAMIPVAGPVLLAIVVGWFQLRSMKLTIEASTKVSQGNSEKLDKQEQTVAAVVDTVAEVKETISGVQETVATVEKHTNGMLEAAKSAAKAKGVMIGHDAGVKAGVKQERLEVAAAKKT